jgi:hypothetical protein
MQTTATSFRTSIASMDVVTGFIDSPFNSIFDCPFLTLHWSLRITEYPGFTSLHSDAAKFHATDTGENEARKSLASHPRVRGAAFQSDFEDIDRIRHDFDMAHTTDVERT